MARRSSERHADALRKGDRVREQPVVRVHAQLGLERFGPAGRRQAQRMVGADLGAHGGRTRRPKDGEGVAGCVDVDGHGHGEQREVRADRRQLRFARPARDEHGACPGVVEVGLEFAFAIRHVQRQHHRADLRQCQMGGQVLPRVRQVDADHVAVAQARRPQPFGQRRRRPGQLAPGDGAAVLDRGGVVRSLGDGARQRQRRRQPA